MSTSVNDGVNPRDYVSQVATFRHDFRQYIRTLDCADEWRTATYPTTEAGLEHDAAVMARLHADGWNRYGWPDAARVTWITIEPASRSLTDFRADLDMLAARLVHR